MSTRREVGYDQAAPDRASDYALFAAAYPDFVASISAARKDRRAEMEKLRALPRRDARDRARKLLRSDRLALLYAYEATRRVQQLHRSSPDDVRHLAERCNPFAPTIERVHRRVVPQGGANGTATFRLLQTFGPLKRMHHLLVADVLAAIHPPRADQYLFNGGMPAALQAVEDAFREGYTHAVEADFINFYGSVRQPGLAELLRPLPAAVTEHVVWDATSRRHADDDLAAPRDEGDPSLSGLVGLSLGAASSPIVGETIIADVLRIAECGRVVTYADNILVLGRDAIEVEARAQHLRECAERHEAGPLRTRSSYARSFRPAVDRASVGVQFAGQYGQAIRHRLNWAPSPEKQIAHHIADTADRMTLEEISAAERRLAQWRRSYPMWRLGDRFEIECMAELAAARYYVSPQPEHLAAARNALLLATWTGGPDRQPDEFAPEWPGLRNQQHRERLLNEARSTLQRASTPAP